MIKEPEFFKGMKGPARWEWLEKQKATLAQAVEQNAKVELRPETAQALLYLMQAQDLKHCELVTMHHNAVVVVASSLVEKDPNMQHEWLLNLVDNADCAEWQMYESGQEFYDRNRLPWPESQEDHRNNIKENQKIQAEDDEKFEVWYAENVMPRLVKGDKND